MLQQKPYLARSVVPHGKTGAACIIPSEVRKDLGGVEPGDSVDFVYDREEGTLKVHFNKDN